MQRILLSALVVGGVVGAAVYGTTAFFSDSETSTNNTFTAGALDLTIDSTAHYNGMVCTLEEGWQPEAGLQELPEYPVEGSECTGTWNATNLDKMPFFSYDDIKPGDEGENTISMHVSNNDAWLRMRLVGKKNAENTNVDPEIEALDTTIGDWCGELAQNMQYSMWVDDGGDGLWNNSVGEGDNIKQPEESEIDSGPVLDAVIASGLCTGENNAPVPTNWSKPVEVAANETQYIGVAWNVPDSVGNVIQTDSIMFDVEFQVEQRRNNPNPFQAI